MRYDFAKLNGIGNDFVMIEDLDDEILLTPEQITTLCDRHFGIGGDGVIIVKPSPRPECAAYMDYYNSDGTRAPILEPAQVPTTFGGTETPYGRVALDADFFIDGHALRFTCVSMGNPHAVTFVDKKGLELVDSLGPLVENCEAFPEGTNVEFAHVDGDVIRMRVWERGCGETLACGTAVAAHICGYTPRKVTLELIGGTLQIEWRESDGHVLMTGPAA